MAKANKNANLTSKKNTFAFDGKRLDEVNPNEEKVKPRLEIFYKEQVIPTLMTKFGYKSIMQVPKLQKICLNIGVGEAANDPKLLQSALNELELITGQRPIVRKAKKAISNFKLRENMPIGASVTLRRARMYEFLDRFINIASPRVRDFKGYPDKSFDGRGNLSVGIKEQIIFPEIDVDKVNRISGMDITFVTNVDRDDEALALLNEFGFPFRKRG